MATMIATPATTVATVTAEGLSLSPAFLAALNLEPGAEVIVTVSSNNRKVSPDIEHLIEETCGMLAHLRGGMAEELMVKRRDDELRIQAKKW